MIEVNGPFRQRGRKFRCRMVSRGQHDSSGCKREGFYRQSIEATISKSTAEILPRNDFI